MPAPTAPAAAATATMRALRFHEYGEPADVLRLESAPVPEPVPGRIRVAVHACGLAPADWALCRGLFPGSLPRGVGCDVAGTVEAVGEGVTGLAPGDAVFGTADFAGQPCAGAAEHAVMDHWFPVPDGLDLVQAAALPMALSTAHWHLDRLGLSAAPGSGPLTPAAAQSGATILINGAGTTIGYAAVQIALRHGLRVIATAGPTHAPRLAALGAAVTAYGEGLEERVNAIAGRPLDAVFDTAPARDALPALIRAAGGDPRRVLTCSDPAGAARLGARDSFHEQGASFSAEARFGFFPEYAQLAAEGRFTVPIAGTFPLGQWRTALNLSLTGQARGKLLLTPAADTGQLP